jgi:ABC-type dipeptide/oligopeptide/nickel transport system permease subunit
MPCWTLAYAGLGTVETVTSPSVPVGDARPWLPRIRRPSGFTLGLVVIATFAVTAVAAPLFAPYSPNETDLTNTLAGMSSAHWLGTDALGRDVLSRLIYGARLSLLGPLIVVTGSTVIAVPLALAATYYGGVADGVLSRVSDALFGFPALLLAIATVAVFGPGFWTPTLVVTITYVPLLARVTRSAVLVEKAKPYTAACRLQGFGNRRIVFAHILPNIIGVVGAQAVLNFGYALLDLAGLAFRRRTR